nr:MAG TPA: tail tape measure [Caudoviricetes sp.]
MAESYSVKAILSAQDKGFTSAFKSAMSSANSLKSTLTSGLGFGIMAGIGQKAFGTITSGIGGMVSELNSSSAAWKTFNGNMSMLGKGADEISSVKKELQEFAEDTIYSASDMASTYAQLSAVGIKSTNKLVKGFGGLAAAAENPKQAMKTLSQQATQMAAKPTVAWADFKLMIEQTPAGIAAVAKEMGMSTTELVQNVQAGTIATEDFFDAIAKVGTNDAFTKLATEYKTVDQAMDGLTETVSNKLAPSFDILSGRAIKSLDGIINKFGEMDGDAIAGKLTSFLDKASGYWNVLKTEASEVKTAFGDAFSAIGKDLGKVTGAFGSTESISSFASVMDSASGALQTFAGFLEEHSEVIAKVIPQIPKLIVAYKGFKIAKSVAPFVGAFTSAIVGLAGAGISKIAGKLFGISKGQKEVGVSSRESVKSTMESAKAFMMLGAGVALISAGFFLLAQGAKAVADSGPLAVGVLAGLVVVVAGLGLGMMKMLSTMSGGTKKLAAMSKAMIAFGASLLMVSAAFYVLSSAAINLASAGPLAIGVMVGMVAAIAGLMIVAKMVGPALTAGAVGLLAFGAAVLVAAAGMMLLTTASISLANAGPLAVGVMFGLIVAIGALMVVAAAVGPALTAASIGLVAFGAAALLVGVGALLAGAALAVVAAVLPIVTTYGTEGATAILQLSLAMMDFAAGTTLAGAGCIILGAGLMVVGAGLALVDAAVIVTAVGMMLLAAGTLVLGAGLSLVASSIMIVAVALPLVAAGALLGVAGFTALMAVSVALGASMLLLTTSFTLLAALSLAATVGITAFGVAMLAGSVGTLAMAAALLSVNSSMKSISKNAKSAQKSITSMKESVSIVNDGLDALGNKAKSAVNSLVSAFNDGAGKAKSAGQKMGDGVKNGVTKGLQPLPNIANQTMSRFNSALSSGASRAIATANMMSVSIVAALSSAAPGAYSSGLSIGINFANGLAASLGRIQSIAAQMSVAASSAAAAKASMPKTRSIVPAETVMEPMVATYGLTYTMDRSIDVPTIASVDTVRNTHVNTSSGGRELSDEYNYRGNVTYTFVVTSELDGKEIAKATAVYTQDELEKLEKRKMRRQGYRNV